LLLIDFGLEGLESLVGFAVVEFDGRLFEFDRFELIASGNTTLHDFSVIGVDFEVVTVGKQTALGHVVRVFIARFVG